VGPAVSPSIFPRHSGGRRSAGLVPIGAGPALSQGLQKSIIRFDKKRERK
jgi:hypothetical protein